MGDTGRLAHHPEQCDSWLQEAPSTMGEDGSSRNRSSMVWRLPSGLGEWDLLGGFLVGPLVT
jgi:hypothetical protein